MAVRLCMSCSLLSQACLPVPRTMTSEKLPACQGSPMCIYTPLLSTNSLYFLSSSPRPCTESSYCGSWLHVPSRTMYPSIYQSSCSTNFGSSANLKRYPSELGQALCAGFRRFYATWSLSLYGVLRKCRVFDLFKGRPFDSPSTQSPNGLNESCWHPHESTANVPYVRWIHDLDSPLVCQ